MRMKVSILVIVLWAVAAHGGAEEPVSLAFSGGVSNFNKSEKWVEIGFEHRRPIQVWGLTVAAGLTVTDDRAAWIFGGLRRDFMVVGPWVVTPAFAIALYEQGGGKDLGGTLEFRSAVEIGYRWPSQQRLAFGIYHLSNAGIYDRNPGMNSLILTYSFPL